MTSFQRLQVAAHEARNKPKPPLNPVPPFCLTFTHHLRRHGSLTAFPAPRMFCKCPLAMPAVSSSPGWSRVTPNTCSELSGSVSTWCAYVVSGQSVCETQDEQNRDVQMNVRTSWAKQQTGKEFSRMFEWMNHYDSVWVKHLQETRTNV